MTSKTLPNPTLYPFESRWFDTEQGRMHYIDEGSGPPLVFVHGLPTWSFLWRDFVRELRGSYRCIAIDHLGFGLSDKPEDADYRPRALARNLTALLDRLDLDDVTLVVHDFGGPIGWSHAMERPERIRALVLLNTWMWSVADEERARAIDRAVRGAFGHVLYRWFNASARWIVPRVLGPGHALDSEAHHHYVGITNRSSDRVGQLTLARNLVGSSQWYESLWKRRDSLRQLPTLLIWGMKDPAFDADVLRRWRDLLPHADVALLEDSGHFPQEEAGEPAVEALREFLARVTNEQIGKPRLAV